MSGDHHIFQEASEPERSKAPTWAQEAEDALLKFRRTKDCSKALKLIAPASERRAQCESAIDRALLSVRIAKACEKSPSFAARKKQFRTYAKKLRAVEIAGRNLDPYIGVGKPGPSFMDQVRRQREIYEELADRIPVRSGSPRLSTAKITATHLAHELLAEYGSGGAPGLTREGPWHRLTTILFENADADLFDYLRNYRGRDAKTRRFIARWVDALNH